MPQVFEHIIVDAEFAALIPPLSTEERQQLEDNIAARGGARDPLVVWVHEEWTPEGCTDPLRYDEARVDEIDGEIRRSWDADDGNYYGDHEWQIGRAHV